MTGVVREVVSLVRRVKVPVVLALLPFTVPAGTADALSTPSTPLDFSRVQTIARGLEVPWALAFPEPGVVLVTERPGRVRVISGGRLRARPALALRVVGQAEAGLLGIALHPDFRRSRVAYLYYTAADGNRVSRFRVAADWRFYDERVLVRGIPAGPIHDGGRLAFGPDRLLYITTGDAARPERAARRGSLAGKVLRVRLDGGVPPGNPFGSRVYSFGHRNPQGLTWDSRGRLYAAEHGPTGDLAQCCHDELNLIRRGGFYGWPFRAGRLVTNRSRPPQAPSPPLLESGSQTWAPAAAAADPRAGAAARIFVATLRAERLLRVEVPTKGPPRLSTALRGFGRLREAVFAPDGCLYLTTSNRDGRGSPRSGDDRVLRVCRRR